MAAEGDVAAALASRIRAIEGGGDIAGERILPSPDRRGEDTRCGGLARRCGCGGPLGEEAPGLETPFAADDAGLAGPAFFCAWNLRSCREGRLSCE